MATFPVEVSDDEGIVDAVNYLLSGPSGLGQNFQGFSAYLPSYLRPSGRQPWSLPTLVPDPANPTGPELLQPLNPSIYLSIPISNITVVGGNPSKLFQVTFTTPFTDAPFEFGDKLDISGVTETGSDTSFNDVSFVVFSCTTTDVTLGYSTKFPERDWNTYVSGGNIGRNYMNYANATDCNGRVTVSGATTQVFISAQINLDFEYTCNTDCSYNVVTSITRLKGFPSQTSGSNDYLFKDEVLISKKSFPKTVVAGTGTDNLESIYSTVLDGPNLDFGYYWYILNVEFDVPGSLIVETDNQSMTLSGTKATSGSIVTYSGLSPITFTGVGYGLVLDITLQAGASEGYTYYDGTDGNTTIDIVSGGNNYNIGDEILINGTSLGGASSNYMSLIVTSLNTFDVTIGKVTTGLRSLTSQVIKQ